MQIDFNKANQWKSKTENFLHVSLHLWVTEVMPSEAELTLFACAAFSVVIIVPTLSKQNIFLAEEGPKSQRRKAERVSIYGKIQNCKRSVLSTNGEESTGEGERSNSSSDVGEEVLFFG